MNVEIEQSDVFPVRRQCRGKVDGDGGFAYAAFAAEDKDHMLHVNGGAWGQSIWSFIRMSGHATGAVLVAVCFFGLVLCSHSKVPADSFWSKGI
ncbi:MAG: hypothetical protein STSR0009_10510 [Methanoregula sp.]